MVSELSTSRVMVLPVRVLTKICRAPTFDMDLSDFMDEGKPISYEKARKYFAQDPAQKWAAYVAGAILVLMTELGVKFEDSISMLVSSAVPEGKGVSSSASVEVASMSAIAASHGLNIGSRDLALLCQKVENHIVGAPCGVMDQMASACGEANKLLAMICQPAEIVGLVEIPNHIRVWGIDSGIRHSVGGADYGSVRIGTFMGMKMIKLNSLYMAVFMMKLPSTYSPNSLTLLRFMLLLVLSYRTNALVKLPPNVTVPALIAFGDSIMDTGNNNNIKTIVKCNFPPYGQDFEGGIPTGRFCNGKNPSDLIVEELGIKELLPAYLDPNLKPSDLPTGVCFASGASGYDPLTPKIVSVISLADQLKMFKEYIGKLKGVVGENRANFILANALFLIVAGSDDLANTYFTIRTRQLHYDVPAYADLMVKGASDFIKEIYQLGARRIGVFSAAPIGYLPSQKTLGGGVFRKTNEKYNEAAKLFNSKLSKELDYLHSNLPNSRVIYIDIYSPLLDIILKPQKYGYKVADKGCCGTGKLEVSVLCNPLSATCPDNSEYIFWDSYHPTESVYRKLVAVVLPKYVGRLTA